MIAARRLRVALLLAALASGGCGERVCLGSDHGSACSHATCGAPCALDACDDSGKPPSMDGRCDGDGMCVPKGAGMLMCPPCTGKKCGEPCMACAPEAPMCMEPPGMKACDRMGMCVPVPGPGPGPGPGMCPP